MSELRNIFKTALLLSIFFTLAACGGGGGASGDGASVADKPSITSFTADATTISSGATVNLTAIFNGGTGSIDNGIGRVNSGISIPVKPASTTTYSLTITNDAGTTTSTLTIIVNNNVLGLSALSLLESSFDQTFQPNQLSYTAAVGFLTKSVKVYATTTNVGASITVNDVAIDTSNSSQSITLVEGLNSPIIIVVTGADLSTVTYNVEIIQQLAAAFAQQAYIKASNSHILDSFGNSVSISGDTLAVSAFGENGGSTGVNGDDTDISIARAGAVYIFTRLGNTWIQQAYIKASNTGASDQFGSSVSLLGDTLAVGAVGEGSSATGIDGDQTNNSRGRSGAVYIFTRGGTTWTQQAYIKASNTGTGDNFGLSISLSENKLAVGAPNEGSSATGIDGNEALNSSGSSGAVYVFNRAGTTWTQEAYIKASNTATNDQFGTSVSLFGNTLAVGAFGEGGFSTGINGDQTNGLTTAAGAVYVFLRSAAVWEQQAYIKASNTGQIDMFGNSVALFENTLAVGAIGEGSNAVGVNNDETNNSRPQSGAVYIFTRNGTAWSQQAYIKASNSDETDKFGSRVYLQRDILAVGVPNESSLATGLNGNQLDNTPFSSAGAVYTFTRNGDTWVQLDYVKASNTDSTDRFGISIAVSGSTLVVGATGESSSAIGVNGNQVDNSVYSSGAVYIFD